MANTQAQEDRALEELRGKYVEARRAFKEAEKNFAALTAGFTDMPEALKTNLSHIELTGPDSVAVGGPSGPPWARPANPPPKPVITSKEWPRVGEYAAALRELRRKQEEAEKLYNALPELDRQLGSQYRSPLEP
jgi:hypothetical protein